MHHALVDGKHILSHHADEKICTDPRNSMPMSIGAMPAGKRSHQISFITRYTMATTMLKKALMAPTKVARRRPAFGVGSYAEHSRIIQTVEIVVSLSGPALRLLVRNLLALIAKLCHNAAQKRGRIIQIS